MGFDIERFVGDVNEGLLCSICRDVLEEPLQARCEHAFCSTCIHGWLTHYKTCPEDRLALWPSDLKPIFRYMKNDLDKLKIKCDNEPRGCKEVMCLDSLTRHVKEECGYVVVACHNLGCGEKLNRCELEAHLLICDYQAVNCAKGCGLKVCMSELDRHNCVAELRKALEQQKIDGESTMNGLRQEFESRLDSHRVHMLYKESALQSQIEDLKTTVAEVMRETRSLKSERNMDRLFETDSEKREIMDWLRGLKYRDEIAEKYCSSCNKRYLYVRKEPLQSFGEQLNGSFSHSCQAAFPSTSPISVASGQPLQRSPGTTTSSFTSLDPVRSSLLGENSSLNRAIIASWRRTSEPAVPQGSSI